MQQIFKVTQKQGRNIYGINKVVNGKLIIKEALERGKVEYINKGLFVSAQLNQPIQPSTSIMKRMESG